MRVPRLLAIALLAMPLAAVASPDLNIGSLYDYLDGNKSILLKKVRNSGDSTAFVKVSVVELVYDKGGVAREVDTEGLPLEQRGLVASPARLIVPARGMQAVRLLYRGSRAEERYFRLRFMPVLPELGDGFAVDEQQAQAYRDSLRAGVNLLAGFGSLLFVRPAQPHYQTTVRRNGGQLTVLNQGNTTVVLDQFRQCRAAQEACDPVVKHHLLPGRTRQFEGDAARVHQFELHEGDKRTAMVVER